MRLSTVDSIALAVRAMEADVGRTFTNAQLAQIAMFSKFHFNRVFQEVTGIPPGRFLRALRLAEAKRLLLTSGLSVTDIGTLVGYSSSGTFSTQFKHNVGMPPREFRANDGYRTLVLAPPPPSFGAAQDITGQLECSVDLAGTVFVGAFPEPTPRSVPVACTVLPGPGRFRIENVPAGRWHLFSLASARGGSPTHDRPVLGSGGQLEVTPGKSTPARHFRLRPPSPLDPPVLPAPFAVQVPHPA
ncbi:helix-turn-helix transcriptional regulator [Kineosporia succinea]|uniref:AraC-like DNA-binding protein n=1 Tax=Kineosporia succinea TaxID=84632 RepID=A0ABT9PCI9_9ACTN|nr:helix-turn-helix transcriptional regulator [Kineosporia succinea]MDP9829685.1 AraC-like DNA-binding protein [Kineosporia succinea]